MEKTLRLRRDGNLSDIFIYPDGTRLAINFLSSFDGGAVSRLTVYGVIAFNFHNTFDCPADALPTYVGEVTCRPIAQEQIHSCLGSLAYGFTFKGDYRPNTLASTANLIHIEGGEVAIDILCGRYEIAYPARRAD